MKPPRDLWYSLIIAVLIATCAQFYYDYHYVPAAERAVTVYYNKDTEANRRIIDVIQNADSYVYFAIYTFTRGDIKDALLAAKARGLDVRGVTDRDQVAKVDAQRTIVKELQTAGIPVGVQDHSAIMHIKTVVTEKQYASGSYNWTTNATDNNDEVLEVGRDETIRKQYLRVLKEVLDRYPPVVY
jgi:phosphatidylserine/phosphatidylglycerophosphate/cardiolipin synthase-like enzyme